MERRYGKREDCVAEGSSSGQLHWKQSTKSFLGGQSSRQDQTIHEGRWPIFHETPLTTTMVGTKLLEYET